MWGTCAERVGNVWGTCGEREQNMCRTCAEREQNVCRTCGERVQNVWGTCGERVGNVWGTCGERVQNVCRTCELPGKALNVVNKASSYSLSTAVTAQCQGLGLSPFVEYTFVPVVAGMAKGSDNQR